MNPAQPIQLTRRLELGALGVLFWLTVRRHLRAKRLIILAVLFLLPTAFAIFARVLNPDFPRAHMQLALVFYFIPHALVPLTALLFASGMIQDELEEQTLTYLMVRPLPRWGIYFAKFLATWLVTVLLATVFTFVTHIAIFAGDAGFWTQTLPRDAVRTSALLSLALLGYCAFFGWTSLLVRRSFIIGVAYIVLFEGVIANIDFVARRITVMYYFRVLAERWLELKNTGWAIDLKLAPTASECVWTLSIASAVLILLAILSFSTREWRVKTPEGS